MGLLSQLAQPAIATTLVARMAVLNICMMFSSFLIARVILYVSLPTPAFVGSLGATVALSGDFSARRGSPVKPK
jgi:hypothetical protein